MLDTPIPPKNNAHDACISGILDNHPALVVDIALQALQRAGIRLIEWHALLYRRMTVPILVKDFSYVIPDDDMEAASDILTELGLLLSPTSTFRTRCDGEFHTKGRFHRITHSTLECSVQHFVLYPLSFSSLDWSEVTTTSLPYTAIDSMSIHLCSSSICCICISHPHDAQLSTVLFNPRKSRVGPFTTHRHLLGLKNGYVDADDDVLWESLEIDQRIINAVLLVRQWSWDREWREDEEWIGDALAAVVDGSGGNDIEYLPYKS